MNLFKRFKKEKPQGPDKSEVLRARPIRNSAVTWGLDNKGEMVIHIPLERKGWAMRLKRFMPAPEVRHIILDDVGADVWELCDGENSIESIRRRITEKYKLNHKEAEASLIAHLQQLSKRKLIVTVAGSPEVETESMNPVAAQSKNNRYSHRNRKKR